MVNNVSHFDPSKTLMASYLFALRSVIEIRKTLDGHCLQTNGQQVTRGGGGGVEYKLKVQDTFEMRYSNEILAGLQPVPSPLQISY